MFDSAASVGATQSVIATPPAQTTDVRTDGSSLKARRLSDIGRRSHDVVAITIEPLNHRQISETALAASPVQHCNNINGLGDQGAGTVTTAS
jgi:hypothetical protein